MAAQCQSPLDAWGLAAAPRERAGIACLFMPSLTYRRNAPKAAKHMAGRRDRLTGTLQRRDMRAVAPSTAAKRVMSVITTAMKG